MTRDSADQSCNVSQGPPLSCHELLHPISVHVCLFLGDLYTTQYIGSRDSGAPQDSKS